MTRCFLSSTARPQPAIRAKRGIKIQRNGCIPPPLLISGLLIDRQRLLAEMKTSVSPLSHTDSIIVLVSKPSTPPNESLMFSRLQQSHSVNLWIRTSKTFKNK
ncbi:hypothetical protein AMEX_G9320 [Astyanax mexicanus]|uniref:Uncharacterized protein n=1 Tax=Astyanax mexicanus TaxID=7994 RepID=A0A8T2LT27_ASTMX|nr:hypothetical protein AMEX_G9320 [Astyanax mexicanus]